MLLDHPRLLSSEADRARLAEAMRILSNVDIMKADESVGVLFTEDYTDLNILREWARVLRHPIYEPLLKTIMCKSMVTDRRDGLGIPAKDYYDALTLVRADLPGVFLVDGDCPSRHPAHSHNGQGIAATSLEAIRGRELPLSSGNAGAVRRREGRAGAPRLTLPICASIWKKTTRPPS